MPSITLTVTQENWPEYLEAFLLVQPVPPDPETGEPSMTETQWAKEWLRRQAWAVYRAGRKRKRDIAHSEDADPDIIA